MIVNKPCDTCLKIMKKVSNKRVVTHFEIKPLFAKLVYKDTCLKIQGNIKVFCTYSEYFPTNAINNYA
jgi:hypothetical protein